MANELRKAINNVSITGVVKEVKDLKENKGDNGKYINGSLVVKAGSSEITVKVFVQQMTKTGNEKKAYTNLKKFIDGEFNSMATDSENPARIKIYGNGDFTPQLKEDIYVPKGKTKATSSINVDLGFGNVIVDNDITEEEFGATFDIEMFVKDVIEEVKKVGDDEEETGRVIVKGLVPCYNGTVFPLNIVTGIIPPEEAGEEEYDFASDVRDGISQGGTINIWGNINYERIVEKKKKGGSLGKAKIEDKTTYIHELVGTGAEVLEDEDKQFDEDLIAKAVKERNNTIKEEEAKAQSEDGENKGKGLKTSGSKEEGRKPKKSLGF